MQTGARTAFRPAARKGERNKWAGLTCCERWRPIWAPHRSGSQPDPWACSRCLARMFPLAACISAAWPARGDERRRKAMKGDERRRNETRRAETSRDGPTRADESGQTAAGGGGQNPITSGQNCVAGRPARSRAAVEARRLAGRKGDSIWLIGADWLAYFQAGRPGSRAAAMIRPAGCRFQSCARTHAALAQARPQRTAARSEPAHEAAAAATNRGAANANVRLRRGVRTETYPSRCSPSLSPLPAPSSH